MLAKRWESGHSIEIGMGEPAKDQSGQAALHGGLLVADKYSLIEARGEGAMGSVWSAKHLTLGHTVAIKFLHGSVANNAEPRARFEREARLAARLGEASRHITRVTDHGVTAEGTPFLVMELLSGEGLEVRLKRERRLPFFLLTKITTQLCRALHVAHGAGVIHRDLKPANVFLCEDEGEDVFVKLLDFGVAKATLDHDENQATRAGALIGTPNYMSPEQIVGEAAVDIRSDLWALAAIVYRMAVGRAPFGSGSLSELAMRIVSTEPPVPTTLAPDLPHEFDLWVKKGLAKKPNERFQNAKELAESLAMVAGLSASGSTGAFSSTAAERLAIQIGDSVGGLQHTVGGGAPEPPAATVAQPAPAPRSRAPIFALAGVLAVAAVGVGLYAARGSGGGTVTATPATTTEAPKEAKTKESPKTPATEATAVDTSQKKDDTAPTAKTAEPDTTSTAAATTTAVTKPKTPLPMPKAKPTATAKTAEPTPTVAPPPPPPTATTDPNKKSPDTWNKKDEM
jgi:serine/threonine-protein kinase